MGLISRSDGGSFKNTFRFLERAQGSSIFSDLDKYGRQGVEALRSATPVDTGDTAGSWEYRVTGSAGVYTIEWLNTNNEGGVNVAILIQYGHGTGTGGYVAGYDYINPAVRPIFDQIANDMWRRIVNG